MREIGHWKIINQDRIEVVLNLSPKRVPSLERKPSPRMGINQIYENQDKRPTKFIFPDAPIIENRRRNSSINYSMSPRKTK